MPIRTEYQNEILTALLQGDIDHHTASAMREVIDRTAESCLPQKLVLDFSGVSFMDSSGIGLVIGRYKRMARRGGSVAVTDPGARVDKLFQMSGIYQLVDKLA